MSKNDYGWIYAMFGIAVGPNSCFFSIPIHKGFILLIGKDAAFEDLLSHPTTARFFSMGYWSFEVFFQRFLCAQFREDRGQ